VYWTTLGPTSFSWKIVRHRSHYCEFESRRQVVRKCKIMTSSSCNSRTTILINFVTNIIIIPLFCYVPKDFCAAPVLLVWRRRPHLTGLQQFLLVYIFCCSGLRSPLRQKQYDSRSLLTATATATATAAGSFRVERQMNSCHFFTLWCRTSSYMKLKLWACLCVRVFVGLYLEKW
jgi:hypothetical protein